jgi:6-phosphogluconolactonase
MPDTEALVSVVCARINSAARQAIAARGTFRIVLAGGTTPAAVYRALAETAADWPRWQIYFGDERCLPLDNPERNSVMAMRNWLDGVAIPSENIHVIPAEHGASEAAHAYDAVVKLARPFDLVLLGMGEDGHTASLFPDHQHDANELVHAIHNAPKPPSERVSLGERALNDAQVVLVLITGMAKHAAVERWKHGEDLPIARIHGRNGIDVYLDRESGNGYAF